MTMPKSLLDRADENVSQALQTGARGQTTTHTDYGVIGDAFFKKAQLDLQIADLHANMGLRKAEISSNLEIQKANLNLNARKLQIDAGFQAAEMKAQAADREVSFAEQLMGSIGGAASGAMAGYAATGDKKGAILGAATGGGMTMMGYQQGGRRGGQQAQQTLGHISDLSIAYKGMKQEQTQKDAWTGVMQSGKAIMDELNSAQTPQERLQAMQKMEGFYGEAFQVGMSMPGANPEKVGNMVASMRKGFEAAGGMSGDPREMKQLETLVKYQSDDRRNNPKTQRAWANDYLRETNADYEEIHGKPMPINMQRQAAYDLSPAIGEALDKKISGEEDSSTGSFGSMPKKSARTTSSPSEKKTTPLTQPKKPIRRLTDPEPVEEPTTSSQSSLPGGIPFRPGIQMDDGGEFNPVKDEQKLTELGGKAVKALSPEEEKAQKPGLMERILDHPLVSREGSLPDKLADKLKQKRMDSPEFKAGAKKISASVNDEAKKMWQDHIDAEAETLGPETAQVLYTSTNPNEIGEAMGTDNKVSDTPEKAKMLSAIENGPANMNRLKEKSLKLNEVINKHMPNAPEEEKRALAESFVMWKYGEGGPEGDMRMKGKGGGASIFGGGAQFQSFEKNYSMQLEKMGLKPNSPGAKEIFKSMTEVDTLSGPLAMQQAVSAQGSKPTDKDVSLFNITNALDRDPEIVLSAIHEQQRMMINGNLSLLDGWETKAEKLLRLKEEGEARRQPANQTVKKSPFLRL